MFLWSSFRQVPPIAPEAMAWATLSFAVYLAAVDMQPMLWGRVLDPLALALAVQMTLSMTKNMTSGRFARASAASPRIATTITLLALAGFAALACFATTETAAKLFIAYFLSHAAILSAQVLILPEGTDDAQSTWGHLSEFREGALLLEAAGIALSAATLWTVWVFAGPLAFAAMMSFGVLVLRTISNWIIVLYLLERERDTSGDS